MKAKIKRTDDYSYEVWDGDKRIITYKGLDQDRAEAFAKQYDRHAPYAWDTTKPEKQHPLKRFNGGIRSRRLVGKAEALAILQRCPARMLYTETTIGHMFSIIPTKGRHG